MTFNVRACWWSAPGSGVHCVERARDDLAQVDAEVVDVRFEDLVARPRRLLTRVVTELGLQTRDGRA